MEDAMPGENPIADVEKLLADKMAVEDRRKALIEQLLKMKAQTCKVFDDKLAQLGYRADKKPKRSHHKKPSTPKA
jgi:hypothetical protein